MTHDDRTLLEQWSKTGDGEAFRMLVLRYGGMVYAACRRVLGNSPDTEDVVQECFEALAVAGTKPGGYVGAWLHRVATYHAISHVRREVRRKERETQYAPQGPEARDIVEWKDIYSHIDEAINGLPEQLRHPLIAHFLEGQSKEAVAQALGISRQLASYRIERGLDGVRKVLRRKGVLAGSAVVAWLLGAHAVQAAPVEVMARLGKIAMTGPGVTAPVAAAVAVRLAARAATRTVAVKVAGGLAAALLVVTAVVFLGWKEIVRPYPVQHIVLKSRVVLPETKLEVADAASAPSKPRDHTPGDASPQKEPATVAGAQVLEPGTEYYGVVLDEAGRPVPGATVTLDNREAIEQQRFCSERFGYRDTIREVNQTRLADGHGCFSFGRVVALPGAETGLVLSARSGERYASKTIGSSGDCRRRYHELVLVEAGVVRGRVVDEQGAGVDGCIIRVSPALMRGEMESLAYYSGPDGTFESRPLEQGMYELFVTATGFREPQRPMVRADGTLNTVRLERNGAPGSISGWVVDAATGQRVPGVSVQGCGKAGTKTDRNGEFRLDEVPAGKWALAIARCSEQYALTKSTSIQLMAGQQVKDVELKVVRGVTVSGRVVAGGSRRPVPYARVSFERGKDDFGGMATADHDGRFMATQLAPGDYVVHAYAPRQRWDASSVPFSVRQDVRDVEFSTAPLKVSVGRVVNDAGAPVSGASVARIAEGWTVAFETTDANGEYEIQCEDRLQSFYVQAYGDDGMSRSAGPIRVGESIPVLTLESTGRLQGCVVDGAGQPVAGALVRLLADDDECNALVNADGTKWSVARGEKATRAVCSVTGAFDMAALVPGHHYVEVYLPSSAQGYPMAETDVTIRAGETVQTRLVLDLAGYSTIEGCVTQGGRPLAHVNVGAYSKSADWVRSLDGFTDANGRYLFPNVRAGEVTVSAYGSGRTSRSEVVQLAESETRTVDFDFGEFGGGIEGYVTVNGKPGVAFMYASVEGGEATKSTGDAATDGKGYYRMEHLAPGRYVVKLDSAGINDGRRIMPESTVEVAETGLARCDFTIESGGIDFTVQGLDKGEKAGVGVFPGVLDARILLSTPLESFDGMMTTYLETPGPGKFHFDDIPAGTYTVAAVALPETGSGDDNAGVAAGLAARRFFLRQVDIAAGKTVTLDIVLPRK